MDHRILVLAGIVCSLLATAARAEPYIAVQQGLACAQCHLNPTGGGARNVLGNAIAQTQLAARPLPAGAPTWTGALGEWFATGGDLRAAATWDHAPGSTARSNLALEQARAYLGVSVIPERVLVYFDEQLGPDNSLNREAWVLYRSAAWHGYVKAGRMYLPFGLRLQDQQAYTRQVAGINMDTPDNALELGYRRGNWDAQLALSNGLAGGSSASNGRQFGLQLVRVVNRWRVGIGLDRNDNSAARSTAGALFAGLRTGPLAWLAEVDRVQAARSGASDAQFAAALLECNWRVMPGANLKLTAEWLDPDRRRSGDLQQRRSVVFELTPLPYLQLRAGARTQSAAPSGTLGDSRQGFLEVHGYF
jgi:hypothetical protein